MKKPIIFTLAIVFSMFLKAQNIDYDQYFRNSSLRMDFYQCGNADTSHYAFERFNIENYFGGSKVNLIDPFNYGDSRVKVIDAQTNTLIYSRGYNTLFREWQTTNEATLMERCYEESVSVPAPQNDAYIIIEKRNHNGEFEEVFSKLYERYEIYNSYEQRYVFPVYDVMVNGTPESKVDIVILPEGYTAEEMSLFQQHCHDLTNGFMQFEPFASHINDFNIRAVLAPSEESGIDIPSYHTWVRTILNAQLQTFYIDRYCTTRDYFSVKDVAANAPYDQIVILVNDGSYSGAGFYNFYSMITTWNLSTPYVFVHEFGHAFAGLDDEYAEAGSPLAALYNLNVEPWQPNLTTLVDFDSKWADLVAPNTPIPTPDDEQYDNIVGAFEGAGYLTTGIYRPQTHCMMRDFAPFCAVCSRAIEDMIAAHSDSLVLAITDYSPSESSFHVCPNPATDFIDVFVEEGNCQAEIIDMNGRTIMSVPLSNTVNRIAISNLPNGAYILRANGEARKFVKQ